jgi:hypothetical protein
MGGCCRIGTLSLAADPALFDPGGGIFRRRAGFGD